LKELSTDSLAEIKEELINTLNWIIQSDWKKHLLQEINLNTTLILPDLAVRSKSFIKEFRNALSLSQYNDIIMWDKDDTSKRQHILIMYYRDSGPFPFTISPNIFEHGITPNAQVNFSLVRVFFEN